MITMITALISFIVGVLFGVAWVLDAHRKGRLK